MIDEDVDVQELYIDGILYFDDTRDRSLKANNIWIQRGELIAGSYLKPFPKKIEIQLKGTKTDSDLLVR